MKRTIQSCNSKTEQYVTLRIKTIYVCLFLYYKSLYRLWFLIREYLYSMQIKHFGFDSGQFYDVISYTYWLHKSTYRIGLTVLWINFGGIVLLLSKPSGWFEIFDLYISVDAIIIFQDTLIMLLISKNHLLRTSHH